MAQVNLQRTASQINSEESYEDEERQSTADETTTSKGTTSYAIILIVYCSTLNAAVCPLLCRTAEPPIDDWKECFDAKTNRKYGLYVLFHMIMTLRWLMAFIYSYSLV
jgi:hypothetical protein